MARERGKYNAFTTGLAGTYLHTSSVFPISLSAALSDSIRIDGFDISSAQFPPKEWLPANVRLYTCDAFSSFPFEYHGLYDVVHVRFFMTLLTKESLGLLIGNLRTLLSTSLSNKRHE